MSTLAVVVIGRNEGERLRRCLASVALPGTRVVYVDSGSSDGSQQLARSVGADVVELDLRTPFTAARARNAGWRRARELAADARLVQFVDGDCEVRSGWLEVAQAHLESHDRVAAVAGRLRERFPERSIYNQLCDIEWNTPPGETKAVGGIAMMRIAALAAVDGFREDLIAGEEPELCVRLRAAGWTVWRLPADMAWHDAAMTRFSQWWRRAVRAGFAFAEGAHLHGRPPERHWVRESRSALAWGLLLPLAIVLLSLAFGPLALWLAAAYPLQMLRLYRREAGPARTRLARAFFLVLGKFAEALGELRYALSRLRGGGARLIEYK
ncbi:glycosyltransferase [Piscinibacter sp. XHJ-5]|uniref:glycosyltransferase family 2 protein n=1 Tax=Piscinibacter sp. XHJ-5 TaxID=3037797 RepID=UPI0024528D6B|nr:glycosyltransferase [Piscinibacter sp. XHJ-5]